MAIGPPHPSAPGSGRHGIRALVTRPQSEAEALAAALAERGVAALIEPLLEVWWRDGPAPDLAGVQAVLCTSANGARALARLSRERGLPLFAVGDATAARARSEGFCEVVSAGGTVEDLARVARERLHPAAGRLLHVAGSEVAGDLAGSLQQRGFAVQRAVLYDARPVAALSAPTLRAFAGGLVDYALFFSPRTAAAFVTLAERADAVTALRRVTAVSISAAADTALGDTPFRARRVAAAPTQSGLLATLDALLSERRQA